MTRLAVLTSHPIQYYGPLFRELGRRIDLHVFFANKATAQQQAQAGFGTPFDWDVDLTSGYAHSFLTNVARSPGTGHFFGCDTPEIGCRLREGRFDALLIMGWHLKSFLQGLFAANRLRLPVMVRGDSHLQTPRSSWKRISKALVYPPFLRLFDAALFVGQRSRAYYGHYRYPDERLFFSPHCVDTDWFAARATPEARARQRAKLSISPDTWVVLFGGKLVPFKRPLDVIAATAACRASGRKVEVMAAGDGELKSAMIMAAKDADTPFHALGFCNQSEMPAVYAAADCLVLPSDGRETWGLVANEALACGRPIIVSAACGCAPDLVSDAAAGRVFPTGDVASLSRSIMSTMTTPPSASTIAALSMKYSLRAAADGILLAMDRYALRRV